MKTIAIQSGAFAASGTNFTGYTASGQQVNIYAKQLLAIGVVPGTPVQFPIYALVQKKEHTDKNNEKFTRWDAGSVFKTADEMLKASIEDKVLALKAQKMLKDLAAEAGLGETALAELQEDAF